MDEISFRSAGGVDLQVTPLIKCLGIRSVVGTYTYLLYLSLSVPVTARRIVGYSVQNMYMYKIM